MPQHISQRREQRPTQAGMTLLELIIACGILLVLSSAALPLARVTIKRQREAELRRDLRELRDSIDRYKNDADKNLIRTEVGSENYPPDLETLVAGVNISAPSQIGVSAAALAAASGTAQGGGLSSPASTTELPSKVRYLRKIPVDPMTGAADWTADQAPEDEISSPDQQDQGGIDDVHSSSTQVGTTGTAYNTW